MKFSYLIEPPFNYVDSSGYVTGSDVELARHVFSELGIVSFEPVETEFAELLHGLADGRWRMTTGLFSTDERRSKALFSRPIWALPDGFLVRRGNPLKLTGYAAIAKTEGTVLAVIRDQFQHRSAVDSGIPEARIRVFETYTAAAKAVRDGHADAYASVGRAHSGFVGLNPGWPVEVVVIPDSEKPPAFGAFAFAPEDSEFRDKVDEVLLAYLGSGEHRVMTAGFGFSDAEVDLVVGADA